MPLEEEIQCGVFGDQRRPWLIDTDGQCRGLNGLGRHIGLGAVDNFLYVIRVFGFSQQIEMGIMK
jgi:hypothetical protein